MPRILIIIIAAIIMLAGAAVTVMQQLEIGPFAPKEAEAPPPPEGAKPEGERLVPPRFVSMDALVIPIVFNDRITGIVQLQVQLETTAENEAKLKEVLPRVDDAFVRDLHGYLPRLLRDKQRLDVELIKRRLMIIAERTIGKGLINSVLIQSAIDRPAAN